jgi:hypothetical protein
MPGPAATGGAADVREEDKMSRSTFASIAAVISLMNAIPGLIAPAAVASSYGVTLDPQSILAGQLLAGSYLGYAVINWTTRGCTDVALCRGLDAGNFVAWPLGAVIWIYAASTGMTNAVGWVGAGLAVIFTAAWAYFVFADRAVALRGVRATRGT